MEKIINVNTRLRKLFCDTCGKEMYSERVLMTFPPQYVYKCDCGNELTSLTKYPSLFYVDDEGNEFV